MSAFGCRGALWVAFIGVGALLGGCPSEEQQCASTLDCSVGETCAEGICETAGTDPEPEAPDVIEPESSPPETEIVGEPSSLTNSNSIEIEFQCADAVECAFECSIDDAQFGFCTSPAVFGGLAEGDHLFRVRGIRDNVFIDETPAEHAFVVDQTPPETTIESAPDEVTGNSTLSFTLGCSDEEGCTYDCRLNDQEVGCGPFPSLADGTYVFTAAAEDAAGNKDESAASVTVTVDTVAAETTLVTGPPPTTGEDDATFTFECDEELPTGNGCTFECAVDESAYVSCQSPYDVTDVEAAAHIFRVRAIDAAGNVDDTPAEQMWTVDGSIPVTQIDAAPGAAIGQPTATLSFSCNREEGCTYTCEVDGAAAVACGSPLVLESLADGEHTVVVTARNQAGTPDPNPPTVVFNVDTVAPAVELLTTPDAVNDTATATFEFSCTDPAPSGGGCVYECALDGADYEACATPKAYTGLADGVHTFEVRGSDLAGNLDVTPELFSWRVDTTAPQTVLDVVPDSPTSLVVATFEFSCEDASLPCSFRCSVDGSALVACSSPFSTEALGEGDHTFSVVASDALEFDDATAASHEWTVDLTAPETTLVGPTSPTSETDAELVFSCNDEPCTFTCSADGAAPSACTSPVMLSGLGEGAHTFEVTASDSGGTADPSPAIWAWEVDVTPPTVVFTQVPNDPSNDPTPTFAFECEGGEVCTFECLTNTNGSTYEACNSGVYTTTANERVDNRFEVLAEDQAGNSLRVFSPLWEVDLTRPEKPNTALVGAAITNNPVAQLQVFCAEANVTVNLIQNGDLQGAYPWEEAREPGVSIGPLADGEYEFQAACVDSAGNESSRSAVSIVTVDTVPPTISNFSVDVPAFPVACTATYSWTTDDGDAAATCEANQFVLADETCTSPYEAENLPSGSFIGTLLLVDSAGNTSSAEAAFSIAPVCD